MVRWGELESEDEESEEEEEDEDEDEVRCRCCCSSGDFSWAVGQRALLLCSTVYCRLCC